MRPAFDCVLTQKFIHHHPSSALKMKPIHYILTVGLLSIASQVFGQLITTMSPATVTAPIGNTVSIQLKVQNFTNVNAMQFPITYNNTILEFDTIDNVALPNFNAGNYSATPGKIGISWFPDAQQYPDGFTVAANTSIFTIHFKVLTNGTTTVNIANAPPPSIEVIANNAPISINYQNGGSVVTGGTGGPPPIQGFAIVANTIYIPQGSVGCMPVTVNDFNNIVAMQYAMHWDPTILQYDKVQNFALPNLTLGGSFGGNTASGLQLVAWDDNDASGETRANGTKIYEVCFNAVGPVGSSSLVTIDGVGFPPGNGGAEAINTASQNVWTGTSGVKDTIFVVVGAPPPDALTFTADKDTAQTGTEVCLDITVKNFDSIIAMQFGMTYDATKLQFKSLTPNPAFPSLSAGNFNTTVSGQIKLSWSDQFAVGVTVPDNTVLFTVCFIVAAPAGSLVPVNFGPLPGFPVETVKEPEGPVTPYFLNGHVFVGTPTGPTASLAIVNACSGDNGSATANVSGGVASSYAWSGPNGPFGGNQQTVNNLVAGQYCVTITLAGGGSTSTCDMVESSIPMVIPTSQVNISNVKCNGQNNGSISLTVNGGTAPLTYDWSGPGNFDADTKDITGLSPGTYTLLVTDAKGCSITSQGFQVTQPAVLTVSLATSKNVTCLGLSDGQATINVAGGTPSPTYSWRKISDNSLVSTSKNPTNLPAGAYGLTITDPNGCTAALANPVIIAEPPSLLTVATPVDKTDVLCWGYNTGSISLNISGGWPGNYNVDWFPQIPGGANPINIPGGTYNCTVTDNGGCTMVLAPIQVIQPPAVTYGTPVVQHNICAFDGNGSIGVTISGGNGGPYSVAWTGGLVGTAINNLAGGSYVPTVTEEHGNHCTAVLPAIIVNEPPPIDTSNVVVTDPTNGQSNGAISLDLSGGTGALTIVWTGPGGTTYFTEDISGLPGGQYNLSVVDASGCLFTATFTVGAFSALATTSPSCGNDGCVHLELSGGTPPFIITWNSGANSTVTTDLNPSICGFPPGPVIGMTVADNASNVITVPPVNVGQLQPAIVSDFIVNPNQTQSNGSIILTPVPDTVQMTYNWIGPNGPMGNQSAYNNLDSGTYIVTVTNPNSLCATVYTFKLVRQWPAMASSPQLTNASCVNTANGSINWGITGGNPPLNYEWTGPNGPLSNDNFPTLNNLLPGNYSITATDYNGTTYSTSITLPSQSNLAVTNVNELSNYQGFQVSGANQCDGIANVVFNGGVGNTSILWSNNVTTVQNNTLCAGTYSVIVTDGLGCTAVWSDSLTYPPGISLIQSTITPISCHGECDGVARVTVSGGVAPYKVQWSTGQIDQNINSGGFSQAVNLCGGNYKVTVTDKLGADYVYDVPVDEPEAIVIEFSSIAPTSFNACNGEMIAQPVGAEEPITYTWSGSLGHSGNNQRAEGLCSGEVVTFILYDANGCAGIGIDTVAYAEDGCYQVRPVITPGQQDGNNDFVFITCIENVPNSIEIFNRWGQLVYEATNYDNASTIWEGTTKDGQPLAEGVYYFVLNVTDPIKGSLQFKGHINLLR